MADEDSDNRPRRRLFGRRRNDELEESAPEPPAEAPSPEAEPEPDPEPVEQEPVESEPAAQEPTDVPTVVVEVTEVEAVAVVNEQGEIVAEVAEIEVAVAEIEIVDTGAGTADPEPDPEPEPEAAPDAAATDDEAETASAGADSAPEEEAGPLPLPRVIAIANQKGGVGKTTTSVNLGASLAELGLRVLVVDLDPQGNASTGLGINPRDVESSIYDVIMNDTPALDAVEPTSLKNLFVIPATLDLAGAEIELVPAFSRELKLKRALDLVRPEYDVVLIDCPPSLGLLTVNGLAAADDVIVPIQCEYYALEGLGQLLRNVALVRSSLNPELDVRGIILTMYDSRTRLAEQVEREVREHFGTKVYKTVVPRTVRLAEAPSFGQPIIVFDSTSRGAKAYRKLAKEVSGGATRRSG
jgi:chromosome partitioning protein